MICKDKLFAKFSQKRASMLIEHLTLFFLLSPKYTNADLKISPYVPVHLKTVLWKLLYVYKKHLAYRKCLYLKNLFYYETIGIFFMGRQICRQTFKYALVYLSSQTFTFQKNLDVGLLK